MLGVAGPPLSHAGLVPWSHLRHGTVWFPGRLSRCDALAPTLALNSVTLGLFSAQRKSTQEGGLRWPEPSAVSRPEGTLLCTSKRTRRACLPGPRNDACTMDTVTLRFINVPKKDKKYILNHYVNYIP